MSGQSWRTWLPVVLGFGGPCLTAAMTAAAFVAATAYLPERPPWVIAALRGLPLLNLVLAGVGGAAGGALLPGSTAERVGRAAACGLGGLLLHLLALLPFAGVAYLVST